MEEKKVVKESTGKKVLIGLDIVRKVIYLVVIIAIIVIVVSKFTKSRVTFNSSSNVIKVDEIEKFNLARFTWNGIAEYYNDTDTEVDTFIKYEAQIEASMNMENFNKNNILVDDNKKLINITLPKIELTPKIVFKDDGKSLSFIPQNTKIEMRDIVVTCEEDDKKKVQERVEMLDIARENAKTTIEGLLLPIIEESGYKIVWKDGE